VSRWGRLLVGLALLGCSGLPEGEGGVVALEIEVPLPATVEVGDGLQLAATALDADGNTVDAPVTWRAADPTVSVSDAGLVTGVSPGTGRVQAVTGSLSSALVTVTVIARADTLILVGDSVRTVPADPGASGDLVVQLQTFSPAGPVAARPVIYEITSPVAGSAPAVALTGGVQTDTVDTGSDGNVTGVQLTRATGAAPVDSAVVEVRALRTRGAEVPGSGQRFIIRFQ
jgi:Big-like domain-containing protein